MPPDNTPDESPLAGSADLPIGQARGRAFPQNPSAKPTSHSYPKLGWRSRGYLPHFDGDDVPQHVTLHLADSLPREAIERIDRSIEALPTERQRTARRIRIEAWIDAGHGSRLLRVPKVASLTQDALLHFDAERYRVFAWVVMPNHVHVLFQPMSGWKTSEIVASWKKFTARKICDCVADAVKPVWHHEYWDRYIRNERHFEDVVSYIQRNPVKAGLVREEGEWPWCSAGARALSP